MAPSKPCTKCGVIKPLTDFHRKRGGLRAICKVCGNAESAARRAKNPGYAAVAAKRWREENPERRRAYAAAYDQENAERIKVWKRDWFEANREHVLGWPARNPERSRERFARYRQSHRDERAEQQRVRRALVEGARVGAVDMDALWTGACGLCAGDLDPDLRWPDPLSKSVDHITPISRGGQHEQDNLQWAHLRCNISKGASMPGEVA